jgi:hypothetical protein
METTQGFSLYSYPDLKLAKMPCFSYYVLCFFLQNWEYEGGTGSAWRQGVLRRLAPGVGGGGRKRSRGINIVQMMYTHVCKCKNGIC